MNTKFPPSLHPIERFLKLARKIEESLPLVSHILKYHAVTKGMELRKSDKDPTVTNEIIKIVDVLEKEKLAFSEKLKDKEILQEYYTNYAMKIFKLADEDDKDGKATKRTAKDFLHAATYFEAYSYFENPIPDEIEQRIVYAKWKSVQISSALEAGEVPQAGPLGFDEYVPSPSTPRQDELDSTREENNSNNSANNICVEDSYVPSFPSELPQLSNTVYTQSISNTVLFNDAQPPNATDNFQLPPPYSSIQPQQIQLPTPQQQHQQAQLRQTTTVKQSVIQTLWNTLSNGGSIQINNLPLPDDGAYAPNEDEIMNAMSQAKCILSSLQFEDVPTALNYLRRCHDTLSGNQTS